MTYTIAHSVKIVTDCKSNISVNSNLYSKLLLTMNQATRVLLAKSLIKKPLTIVS